LENLKPLFQCESIQLSTSINEYLAANDINVQIEDDCFAEGSIFSANHPYLKASDNHSKLLILKIRQDDSLDLILQFSEHSLLEQCLTSNEIIELIPRIQQAVLIAEQIYQQRGDIDAIRYVITHHPLSNLHTSQAPADPLNLESNQASGLTNTQILGLGQTKETLTVSANGELELDVSKEFLKQLYSLTPSESELAKLIFKGLSLQEISDHRSVSRQTIRKQLQSVIVEKSSLINAEKLKLDYQLTETEALVIVTLLEEVTSSKNEKKLKLKEATIRGHLTNIYSKMDVSRKPELIRKIMLKCLSQATQNN
jgi:DNA-binding CsgD family transcriptional regulator